MNTFSGSHADTLAVSAHASVVKRLHSYRILCVNVQTFNCAYRFLATKYLLHTRKQHTTQKVEKGQLQYHSSLVYNAGYVICLRHHMDRVHMQAQYYEKNWTVVVLKARATGV